MSADGAAVLDGRVALVAGASGGIGREVARLLRQAGAWVGMIGRRADVLTSAAAEIGGRPFADATVGRLGVPWRDDPRWSSR